MLRGTRSCLSFKILPIFALNPRIQSNQLSNECEVLSMCGPHTGSCLLFSKGLLKETVALFPSGSCMPANKAWPNARIPACRLHTPSLRWILPHPLSPLRHPRKFLLVFFNSYSTACLFLHSTFSHPCPAALMSSPVPSSEAPPGPPENQFCY